MRGRIVTVGWVKVRSFADRDPAMPGTMWKLGRSRLTLHASGIGPAHRYRHAEAA